MTSPPLPIEDQPAQLGPQNQVAPELLSEAEAAVWRTVAYGDVFHFPLTLDEIHRYLEGVKMSREALRQLLSSSKALSSRLERVGEYIFLRGREDTVRERLERQSEAKKALQDAQRFGSVIANLPFVRMVALTGSVAMANVDRDGDIDFLIVTKPGRVWLCRAFIIGLVKWAARQGVTICPNFVLSAQALAFERQNLYVAREMAQMQPLFGADIYHRLRSMNRWTDLFLPNAVGAPLSAPVCKDEPGFGKRMGERLLTGRFGDYLEKWEQARKIPRFSALSDAPEAAFSPDFCKGHFDTHEARTLTAFQARLAGNGSNDE